MTVEMSETKSKKKIDHILTMINKWEKAMKYFNKHPDTLIQIIPDRIDIRTPARSNKILSIKHKKLKKSRKNSKRKLILASNSPTLNEGVNIK